MSEQKFDQIREHSFDGIQEYDNPLPGWWKNIFWLTIIFSVFYLFYYHAGPGESVQQEYARVSAKVEQMQQAYAKKMASQLNEDKFRKLAGDAAYVAKGKKLYLDKCAACHMANGAGLVGPNLTDAWFIFGPTRMDIYKVIRDGGRKGKGMQAWKNELKTTEMMQLAVFVGTLRGKNLKGKRADGEKKYDLSKFK